MNKRFGTPSFLAFVVAAGCTTPIPDSLHVGSDSGGLGASDGLCDDRAAGVGSSPLERVQVALDCEAPIEDGRVQSCHEASMQLRFADGGITLMSGLSALQVVVNLPETLGERASIYIVGLDGADALSDGLLAELRVDVPTFISEHSLKVVPEDKPNACRPTEGCAWMGMGAMVPDDEIYAQLYPLGTVASGVLVLDGIGWEEDPIVLELEVPLFAPDSEEAAVCKDGLIHYAQHR